MSNSNVGEYRERVAYATRAAAVEHSTDSHAAPEQQGSGSVPIERFDTIAQRYTEQIAVQSAEERLTYGELNQFANQLAAEIVQRIGQQAGCPALCAYSLTHWRHYWGNQSRQSLCRAGSNHPPDPFSHTAQRTAKPVARD